MVQPIALEIKALLEASAAADAFKQAVTALAENQPQDRITARRGAPPIKVLRVTLKLLEERPDLPIESLNAQAVSGCSSFTGHATAQPGDVRVNFHWDCAWRAREQGLKDPFGDPDQGRAARTFGYQCFEKFEFKNG